IGILVDDGIVIAENIYAHWERGKDPQQAAVDGTMEVLPAVLSAVLTTMIAFSTFFFLDGITGDFFVDIAIVVILSLAFSLIEGTFILPGHIAHSKALDRTAEKQENFLNRFQDKLSAGMDWMRDNLYAPQLKAVFKYPVLGLVAPVSILMISFGLVAGGFVSITFFPVIEGDFSTVTLKMPAGTPEHQTMKWLRHIEDAAWEVNEELKAERPDGKDVINIVNLNMGPTTYDGNLLINMLDSEARGAYPDHKSSLAILKRIEKKAGPIDESEALTYALAGPFGKAVSVAIYGDDLDELDLAVAALKDSLKEDARLINVESSDQKGLREINVRLKDKARLLGLDLQTVIGQVRSGFYGAEVQRLQRGEDEVKVWVRYAEVDRNSVGNLEEMYIRTSSGQNFPLKEIAYLEPTRGVISINHLDGLREIRVQADAADASVSTQDVLGNIQNQIMPAIQEQFPSIKVSYEGQVRENTKFATSIQKVGPLILFLMLCMIVLTFRSLSQTLAVLLTIPFALIGVFFGHWILIKPFSIILSGLGVLALIGIMVNDALVLVSQFNILIKNGKPFKEALYEASLSRFRPIFLTSVTTIAGLAPLILEKSLQAQFLIPMAITVAFGLAVATLLILVSLPSFILMSNWYKRNIVALWTGEMPDANEVEPASPNRKGYFPLYLVSIVAILSTLYFLSSLG
ncbi:MAG: efflux RND transporter permease subunit, partial [Bacteroidota bacterium]